MSFPQVLTGVAHIGIPTNDLDKTIVSTSSPCL